MSHSLQNHCSRSTSGYLLPIAILTLSALLQASGSDTILHLRYDRQAILDGEVWRLVTSHFVHLGWRHLALNAIGLWLIWLLFGQAWSPRRWLLLLLLIALGVSLGQLLFDPQLRWAVGLSGLLHGLFAAGAVGALRHGERPAAIMLLVLAAKLLWEQFASPLPGSEQWIGGAVITSAHLYGAISGAACAMLLPSPGRSGQQDAAAGGAADQGSVPR